MHEQCTFHCHRSALAQCNLYLQRHVLVCNGCLRSLVRPHAAHTCTSLGGMIDLDLSTAGCSDFSLDKGDNSNLTRTIYSISASRRCLSHVIVCHKSVYVTLRCLSHVFQMSINWHEWHECHYTGLRHTSVTTPVCVTRVSLRRCMSHDCHYAGLCHTSVTSPVCVTRLSLRRCMYRHWEQHF